MFCFVVSVILVCVFWGVIGGLGLRRLFSCSRLMTDATSTADCQV